MRFSISSSPSLSIVSNYAYISSDDMLVIGALLFLFEALVHFNKCSLCSFITQMIILHVRFSSLLYEIIAHIIKASFFEIFSHAQHGFITFVMTHNCSLEN